MSYRYCFREACHESWTQLRLSPLFGCICPNNHMKRRCDKIFLTVNHNPCVGESNYNTRFVKFLCPSLYRVFVYISIVHVIAYVACKICAGFPSTSNNCYLIVKSKNLMCSITEY